MVFTLARDFQKKSSTAMWKMGYKIWECFTESQQFSSGLQSFVMLWTNIFCLCMTVIYFFPKRGRELNYHDALYCYGALYIGIYDIVVISVLLSLLLSLLLLLWLLLMLFLVVVVKYLLNCSLLLPNYHITNIFIFLYGFLLGWLAPASIR